MFSLMMRPKYYAMLKKIYMRSIISKSLRVFGRPPPDNWPTTTVFYICNIFDVRARPINPRVFTALYTRETRVLACCASACPPKTAKIPINGTATARRRGENNKKNYSSNYKKNLLLDACV